MTEENTEPTVIDNDGVDLGGKLQETPQVEGGDGGESAESAPYEPDYTYSVMDEKHELPEEFRPYIKSKEDEDRFREIFQKASGLDHIKGRRDALEEELKTYKEQWTPAVQSAQKIYELKQKGDLESLFEYQGISDDDIFQYASKRLELRQSPEQFQAHQQARHAQLESQRIEQDRQTYEEQRAQLAADRRAWELDMELARPDVAAAVQDFDTRIGQSGAFRNEVIRRGQAYAAAGQDISPKQAAEEVLKVIGWQSQAANSTQPQVATQSRQQPPVLPNMRGTGSSPARVVPKSLDEMRALAKKLR